MNTFHIREEDNLPETDSSLVLMSVEQTNTRFV